MATGIQNPSTKNQEKETGGVPQIEQESTLPGKLQAIHSNTGKACLRKTDKQKTPKSQYILSLHYFTKLIYYEKMKSHYIQLFFLKTCSFTVCNRVSDGRFWTAYVINVPIHRFTYLNTQYPGMFSFQTFKDEGPTCPT